MALAYCNTTTHLTDVCPGIETYQQKRVVEGWTIASGQSATYYHSATGQVNQVFGDGTKYTVKTSIALTEATASTWYYDSAADILYVHNSAGSDPDGATVIEVGDDWATFKTTMRKGAMELMDSILCRAYNVPLMPRSIQSHTIDDYDYVIVRACALLTCAFIMKRRNPADPIGEKFYREVWNPEPPSDESKGLLNQLLDGDIVLTDQASVKRAGGWILVPYASNTVTRGPILSGEYSGIKKEKWRIQIDTSGAPGTGDYKVSYNGGTSWDLTDQEMIDTDEDEIRMGITEGIYIEWPAGVAQVSGEYWDLYLFPNTDTVETATIGSIELRR